MTVHQKIISLPNEHSTRHELVYHEPLRTSTESALVRGDNIKNGAKALCIKVDTKYVLFALRAYLKLDLAKVQPLTKVKLKKIRFATTDELIRLTNLLPGSVPPFGEPITPLPLHIDFSIVDSDGFIGFSAGLLTASIKMRKQDYLQVVGGQVAQVSSDNEPNT